MIVWVFARVGYFLELPGKEKCMGMASLKTPTATFTMANLQTIVNTERELCFGAMDAGEKPFY
jgi:hypothetical protein